MRNFKTKSIFLNILLAMLCFCAIFVFSTPVDVDKVISHAACIKFEKENVDGDIAQNFMDTGEDYGGKIPFSLFLSEAEPNSNFRKIIDYQPSFTATAPDGNEGTYYYIMDEDSRPSFLLSSSDLGDDTTKLYNSSIFFIFNDANTPDKKDPNSNVIPNESGYLSVTATVNGEPIVAEIDTTTNATTKESSYLFSVNLQPLMVNGYSNPDAKCPHVRNKDDSNTSPLGGEGESNDVSRRTGLYSFHIEYSYREATSFVSNRCVFEMSFYILDYTDYVKDNNPFTFTNTDTVRDNGNVDLNYEVYNYNYLETPIVEIDATKFGINFVYSAGFTNYSMVYDNKSFAYNYTPTRLDEILASTSSNLQITKDKILNGELATGQITIYLKKSTEISYTINTYYKPADEVYGVRYYMAKFDLKDFEKFLVRNKATFNGSTTMQGMYHFDLDFLGQNDVGYSIVDKNLFSYVPKKISGQKLVVFGYELKYFDQDPGSSTYREDVTLINNSTHTNFVAYNTTGSSSTASKGLDTGFLVNIPQYIAITDQAPLRFHSYGNLRDGGNLYTAKYRHYSLTNTTEDDILKYFELPDEPNDYANGNAYSNYLDNNKINGYTSSYTQSASISGDGIRIMKLVYDILLPLTNDDGSYREPFTVTGTQYVVFEVNNTVQNLYIQAIDRQTNTSYDFDTYTNKDIRINLEQKPNTFFAPVNVTYAYSKEFKRDNITGSGSVTLKKFDNKIYEYTINEKKYGYFVTNQNNSYTFADSGYYKVTIRSVVTNSPKIYSFIIDKESFNGVSLNQVKFEDGNYLKSASTLQTTLLSGNNEFLKYDLYVTGRDDADNFTGFTLGWNEKRSGAGSYSFVYYMEITDDTDNMEASLFEFGDVSGDYWLTNGLKTKNLSSAIDNYRNSGKVATVGNAKLEYDQYFNKDGLYFFYVYDDAGNFFTRIVLIDSSASSTLQGYWNGTGNDKVWVDTFDPVRNPQNYVNHDTTIYFGTHKAILLPDLTQNEIIRIEDTSFTRAYDLSSTGNGSLIAEKPKIIIDFNNDILLSLKNYVKTTTNNAVIGNGKAGNYLTIRNHNLTFERTPTTVDLETEEVIGEETSGVIDKVYNPITNTMIDGMYMVQIYTLFDPSTYGFINEAEYMFRVNNLNGSVTGKYICMNFDIVRGTFYGYDNGEGDTTYRVIRKNGATNLNKLKFEYNKITDETAEYYTLKELVYDYYEFVVDESSKNSSKDKYPFASTPTASQIDMLVGQELDKERSIWMIDPINIDTKEMTRAGRYVITRTYVGGTHNLVNGVFVEVGTGGKYYKNEDGAFIDLFELDTITRKYIVYVDHYGIITSTYMVRDDNKDRIREVGDNISITLSNKYDDEWGFKEFFLTSTATLSLDTNKVPIKINIPLSKYFVYYNTINDNLYSKLNFAKLDIVIWFRSTSLSEWLRYKVDGYDETTGFCTSSSLVTKDNAKGYLIFSAAGQYKIEISDRTGYIDITSTSANSNNLFPTTYSYSFEISHTSPYADMFVTTYNTEKKKFETNLLYDDENTNSFATNIKEVNETLPNKDKNKVTIAWNDAVTPYTAKVNQINVTLSSKTTSTKTINIDLKDGYDLLAIAKGNGLINLGNLEYNQYILYLKVSFFEGISEPVIYDNTDYYRFSYEMSVDISEEFVYDITFSFVSQSSKNQAYVDENNNSFAESNYKLTIDRTKPFTNIDNLLKNEEFLSNYYNANNINDFKEEKFNPFNLENAPSAFTYTFGINNNYVLNYNAEDTVPYFFVRSYDKYDDEYVSITPDMVDTVYTADKAYYSRFSSDDNNYGFGIEYPRFAEIGINENEIVISNYKWYKIDYNSRTSLYSLIATATGNANLSGFYEIIEKDYAGNYRAYTVYFSRFEANKNFLILNIDGFQEQGYSSVDNTSDNNITARLMFEATELGSELGWGKVTIKNETLDALYGEEISFNPFDSFDKVQTRLDKLNEFFECEFDSRYSITLARYNSYFPAITRYINIITNESTAKLPAPTVEEVYNVTTNTTTYNMVFPAYTNKSVLYLEALSIHKLEGKDNWTILPGSPYEGKDNIPVRKTGLSKGIYKVTYNDNYNKGNSYSYIVYVGEYYINDFNKEYNFEYGKYAYDNNNNIYYSGGDINVTYESNIYTVFVNGEKISGNTSIESNSPTLSRYNCKTFTLASNYSYDNIPANEEVGGSTSYEIIYRDITDGSIQKVYNFTIFNELPKITLLNAYGSEITSTLEESISQVTSSVVKIDWGEIKGCEFDYLNDGENNVATSARLYSKNQNGEYRNFVTVNKGQTISDEGFYKLQIINNKLGNYREIYFVIKLGDFPLYTISVDEKEIKPSSVENLDFTVAKGIPTGSVDSEELIKVIYSALEGVLADTNINDFNSLKNQLGFKDGIFNPNTVGICSLSDIPHYYSIVNPKIVYNSNMELNVVEFVFKNDRLETSYIKNFGENPTPNNVGTDYWTTVYLVYNLKGPIRIEFFAVTKVPKTNTLLKFDLEYLNEDTNRQNSISLEANKSNYQLYYPQIKSGAVKLSWNKLSTTSATWYNQGNAVRVFDKYGVAENYEEIDFATASFDRNYITSTLVGSGSHLIRFQDIAGNIHLFRTNNFAELDYYTLDLIDSVIYYINYNEKDYNPIQYGVFNDEFNIVIDKAYLKYYLNGTANVNVTRNGSYYNGYEVNENVYSFKESGRYLVEFSASYAQTAGSLRTTTYNFTIIDSDSARLAYEFVEVPGYEITSVIRNGEDITDNFRNENGKVLSLFISSTASNSGNGNYSVTLKYGKNDGDVLTFYFTINNYVPTLSCNVEYGGSTTGSIIISFNPSIIYEQLGECYVRVLTYNNDSKTFYRYTNFIIDENSFTDASSQSIEITRSNSYFVQVETKNGNIISSFRVNRTEPLNTFAIIIIVVSVVAVVVLIIVIVKLRTKMKIK